MFAPGAREFFSLGKKKTKELRRTNRHVPFHGNCLPLSEYTARSGPLGGDEGAQARPLRPGAHETDSSRGAPRLCQGGTPCLSFLLRIRNHAPPDATGGGRRPCSRPEAPAPGWAWAQRSPPSGLVPHVPSRAVAPWGNALVSKGMDTESAGREGRPFGKLFSDGGGLCQKVLFNLVPVFYNIVRVSK